VVAVFRGARLWAAVALSGFGLSLIAGPAHATFKGRDGSIAWSYAVGPDPSQSGSVGVALVNPKTARDKSVQSCDYSFDGGSACPYWSSVNFSPGGDKALWVTASGYGTDMTGPETITVMNAAFSATVTINHPGEDDAQASFSPDGTRLLYVRTIDKTSAVVTSDLAGGNVHVLAGLPSGAGSPRFFPSGRRILFTRNTTIWSAGSDGQRAQPLIPNGSAPDISPDGRSIAYIGVKSGWVYVAHADGTHRHKVSLKGALCRPPRCTGSAQAVVFSPDARTLAFVWDSDPAGTGDPTVYIVPVAGGRIKQIDSLFTDDAGGDTTGLSWQPR
jgi:Tol biopolymer transport system component